MIYWRRSHDFEIVNLLDNGQTPKQVAIDLSISIWTVYRACRRFQYKDNGIVNRGKPYAQEVSSEHRSLRKKSPNK